MRIAGWVERIAYSGHDYIYAMHDEDPFEYSFSVTVTEKDSARRKIAVTQALAKATGIPRHVRKIAAQARMQSTS